MQDLSEKKNGAVIKQIGSCCIYFRPYLFYGWLYLTSSMDSEDVKYM